ncbi:hypothetical protein SAMN05216388_101313 [Halorientalis persicus]|uniref:Uncharacterized protein n=1 Tax=Halorientalis persicus TaxID=1367881 RepID=A0A1H8PZF5_9EURY|nr:hypothetical protein [Halorientalis persicus]SEO47379.1 hypothetical protein SAMN05216388_101313 [Halorientalis persicus]
MSSQIEAHSGQQRALEQFVATGAQPDSHQIHRSVVEQASADSSPQTIRDHVLKTLCRQVPALGVADIHDLRVSLDVDVDADSPVDAQVTTVLQAAVAMLDEWNHL